MNYSRRRNRPDGGHYREMRRRGLKGADEGVPFRRTRRPGVGALLVLIVVGVAIAIGWMLWR